MIKKINLEKILEGYEPVLYKKGKAAYIAYSVDDTIKAIKEAWNEAIDAAAENAKAGLDKGGINRNSILKLKR